MTRADASFRSILCPVDFSRPSRSALRYAAAVRQRTGGRLTVLFAVDLRLPEALLRAYDEGTLEQTSRAQLRRFVASSMPPTAAKGVRYEVVFGTPADEILAATARLGADLVVVGTHGLSGVRKAFFGSITEKLVRASAVPVLAVPPTCPAPPRRWPSRLMTAALDLADGAAEALDAAARVARVFGTPLMAVHVVPKVHLPRWMRPDAEAYNSGRFDEARAELGALVLPAGRGVTIEGRVVEGEPADAIAALAVEERADLLLVPVSGSGGLLHPRQDRTAYRVLCQAPAPLLTLPDAFVHVTRPSRRARPSARPVRVVRRRAVR